MSDDKPKRAVEAMRSEALTKDLDSPKFAFMTEIHVCGMTFTIRTDAQGDKRFIDATLNNDLGEAARLALGNRQFKEFEAALVDDSVTDPDEPGYGHVRWLVGFDANGRPTGPIMDLMDAIGKASDPTR